MSSNIVIEFEEDECDKLPKKKGNKSGVNHIKQSEKILNKGNEKLINKHVIVKKAIPIKKQLGRKKLKKLEYDNEESIKPVSKTKIKSKSNKKKGPGRPRKKPKKEPIPRKGIADTPGDENHVVEILYDLPLLLKKIIAFFKSLASSQIQIIFRPTEIILYAQDHHNKSRIRIKIDGSKLNHYYCERVIDIGLNCKDLELILNKIDKEYTSIILLVTRGNAQKNITVVMDNDIQIDESHTIDVVGQYNHMENETDFIDEDYTVQFTFPGRYFKKTINDIKTMSHQLSIEQEDNTSSVKFGYNSANKKIRSMHTLKNPSKVNLISKLQQENSFRVDIKVDYIKPISSAHIADYITILVDENKKMMTKSYIDNETIEIKTLTDIIDARPDE